MDNLDITIVLCVVVGILSYAMAISTHKPPPPQTTSPDASSDRTSTYSAYYQVGQQWKTFLAHLLGHQQLILSFEELLKKVLFSFTEIFPDEGCLLAIGSEQDLVLLEHSSGLLQNIQHLCHQTAHPPLPDDLLTECANDLFAFATAHRGTEQKWWTTRNFDATLQFQLRQRYQFPGSGLLIPIFSQDVLYGVFYLTGPAFSKSPDLMKEHAQHGLLIAEFLTTWLQWMAPQILASVSSSPVTTLPIHAVATLHQIEAATEMISTSLHAHELVDELAQFSHHLNQSTPELSLLAESCCTTLRNVCHADIVLFLHADPPDHPTTFRPEAISTNEWLWTRHKGLSPSTPSLSIDKSCLDNWHDPIIAAVLETGHTVLGETLDDIQCLVPSLVPLSTKSFAAVPAMLRGKWAALFVIGRLQPGKFSQDMVLIAETIASIAAMSMALMAAQRLTQEQQITIEKTWKLASTLTTQIFEALTAIAKKRDAMAYRDTLRVAAYAESMAKELGLPPAEVSQIRLGAMLCDLGNLSVPLNILTKEGALTREEWALVQEHPKIGTELLHKLSVLSGALPGILYHEERYNGSGYPAHLCKAAIPLSARIIAVADTYVGMLTKRPYREALTREQAIAILRQESGQLYDPDVVLTLLKLLYRQAEAEKNAKSELDAA
jgi:HD-GYP domain-containing protein (c-di-GMP phosphodiesterase class II)